MVERHPEEVLIHGHNSVGRQLYIGHAGVVLLFWVRICPEGVLQIFKRGRTPTIVRTFGSSRF
jgi:hypothetical protein